MGYVFDFNDAVRYEQWLNRDSNRQVVDLENQLLVEMLHPRFGERILDIGCGGGASLMPFLGKGIQLTGIDPSPYMLDIARRKLGHRVDFYQGFAEDLPFDDNSFDYATLCLTLEFADDSRKALEEACRVAKDGVFVGILNKYALKAIGRRIQGIFRKTIFNRARFFSIGEVKYLFTALLGDVPMEWQSISCFPVMKNTLIADVANSRMLRKSPFGAFAGIMAQPVPRFRTWPLTLRPVSTGAMPSKSRPVGCTEKEGRFKVEARSQKVEGRR